MRQQRIELSIEDSAAPHDYPHRPITLPEQLRCPRHKSMLIHRGETLICKTGCLFPIVTGIPRLVASNSYASSFGLQWNAYRTTQLDSNTNSRISYERLSRCFGDSLDTLEGKSVLEAGCGAGRFTEVLLKAGA